jgi:hypothetical protein
MPVHDSAARKPAERAAASKDRDDTGAASPTADPVWAVPLPGRAFRQVGAQAKLAVGSANDPHEREAEQTAAAGPRGGVLGADVAGRIDTVRRRGGEPLPASLRGEVEGAFGADFSAVRLHRDAQANALSHEVGAAAFTLGSDIFFRDPKTDLDSGAGLHLLAHELTHTVQQGAAAPVARSAGSEIRRSIGFEFETQAMLTGTSTTGSPPKAGFANPGAATAMWNSHARLTKGEVLLGKGDIEVQADDGMGGNSDLEVVVNHVPETNSGRNRLNAAMTDLQALVAQFGVLDQGHVVPAAALHGIGGFKSKLRDGLIFGDWPTAPTAPQVTMGVRAQNIPNLVQDLHGDPAENGGEKATRDPGRMRMRRADPANAAQPRALGANEEAQTLINGHGLAQGAIADYQTNVDAAAPGGPELTGFLTIIFTYVESMPRKGNSFLKNHTPLMAKTDLATVWRTLPGPVTAYYGQVDNTGKSKLEELVEQSPGYPAKMNQPLFAGVSGLQEDDQPMGMPQWYHSLTLEDWLRAISVDRDRTKAEAFRDFFAGSKSRGTDKLTTKNFPGRPANQQVEGFGALGSRMDKHGPTGDKLPVFELRSASKTMTYVQARQWALDMFDYIVSLNNNPGGGYQHMV